MSPNRIANSESAISVIQTGSSPEQTIHSKPVTARQKIDISQTATSRSIRCISGKAVVTSNESLSPSMLKTAKKNNECSKKPSRKRVEKNFPKKLMEVLSREDISHIICWLPHGRSFAILNRNELEEKVLPIFFQKCKFTSFVRKLYRWGFRQITKGADADSYFHELFQRDQKSLYKYITHSKSKSSRDHEVSGHHEQLLEKEESTETSDSLNKSRDDEIEHVDGKKRKFHEDANAKDATSRHSKKRIIALSNDDERKTSTPDNVGECVGDSSQQDLTGAEGSILGRLLLSSLSIPPLSHTRHPSWSHQPASTLDIGRQHQEMRGLSTWLLHQNVLFPGNCVSGTNMLHSMFKNSRLDHGDSLYSWPWIANPALMGIPALINGNDETQQQFSKRQIEAMLNDICHP